MIEARKVWKEYQMGKVTLQVLKGVSLEIETDDFVAITGSSGAGKSTLLHLLAGLDTPTRGEVLWEKAAFSKLGDRKRTEFRNRAVGIVFQFYHLLPELSALENVMVPALIGKRMNYRAIREKAAGCLEQVGLSNRLRHRPRELSGGEQQRVAIARALINAPQTLLCDEPTGNLDSKTGHEVIDLLVGLRAKNRTGLVLVTHDAKLAKLAKHTILMEDGRILA